MLEASTENLLHQLNEVYEQLDTGLFQWYVKYRFRNLCLVSKHYQKIGWSTGRDVGITCGDDFCFCYLADADNAAMKFTRGLVLFLTHPNGRSNKSTE